MRAGLIEGVACALVSLITACSPTPSVRQHVALQAIAYDGGPLGGVRFLLEGKLLGETGADGRALVEIWNEGGRPGPIQVVCPPRYRRASEPLRLRAGAIRAFDENTQGTVTTVRCDPLLRSIAVVVSSHQVPGCPVLIDGTLQGETDASGVAHLLLEATPESLLQVELRGPSGSPWRRARTFRVHDQDDVLLVNEDVPVTRRPPARFVRTSKIYRIR